MPDSATALACLGNGASRPGHCTLTTRCGPSLLCSNSTKNRYVNVLPYDFNRVRIATGDDDYINASLLSSEPGEPLQWCYIAAQVCFRQDVCTDTQLQPASAHSLDDGGKRDLCVLRMHTADHGLPLSEHVIICSERGDVVLGRSL